MLKAALLVAALLWSGVANAALVNKGDYALDTDTGLEWLNLNLTSNISFYDTLAGAGGWTTHGWQVASVSQVYNLVETYVGPAHLPTGTYGIGSYAGAVELVDALGANAGAAASQGVYDNGAKLEDIFYSSDSPAFGEYGQAGSNRGVDETAEWDTGTFLVRTAPAVPEPSTWLMMLLGFAGLGYAARRRAVA